MDSEFPIGTIMIVDDTPENIGVLYDSLSSLGHRVLVAKDGESALSKIKQEYPDLILLDIMMPGMDGYEVCEELKRDPSTESIPVIFMTALSDVDEKVRGFDVGAVDYVTKPFEVDEVKMRVSTHMRIRQLQEDLETEIGCRIQAEEKLLLANKELEETIEERTLELRDAINQIELAKKTIQESSIAPRSSHSTEAHQFGEIIGASGSLKKTLDQVAMVSKTDATVLIHGESGTGKELIAEAIHNSSNLKDAPFVKVNCGAIAANLVESELFGHEKGSFTGASGQRKGRFEKADGGTLFLDEIGELTLDVQVKLLRVLQEQEFERLGGTETIKVSVRIICATHRDLVQLVEKGDFREDLFYRLNVFPIQVPPLRERKSDIPLLSEYFLEKYAQRFSKNVSSISQPVMDILNGHQWSGNIRELQNVIERAVILATGEQLDSTDILDARPAPKTSEPKGLDDLEKFEKRIYLNALKQAKWKIGGPKGAAMILDRPVSTVRDRVKKLGIEIGDDA